jgi:hypothetical protein
MTYQKRRLAVVLASGLLVVGCSWLSQVARGPMQDQPPADDRTLRPGPGPVTVEAIGPTSARVAWASAWPGDSVVWFAPTPGLDQPKASAPTVGQTVTLTGLRPATRYFFRVETHTQRGVARTPTFSFRTP